VLAIHRLVRCSLFEHPRLTEKGVQNQLSLVRGDLFGSVQTNVKFIGTTPQSHRRPAGNGLDRHVGAVIGFAAVAIVCALYTMVVTLSAINTLVFAVLGLVAGACAVTMMESVPHQEAVSKAGHPVAKSPVPSPVAGTRIRTDAPDDLLAIVRMVRFVDEEAKCGDAAVLPAAPSSRIVTNATSAF
jgi:hypothetical protein